jgi:signal peptidase I
VAQHPPVPAEGSEHPDEAGEAEEVGGAAAPGAVRNLVEWAAIIAGALLVALVVKTFLFQVFLIPSDSMFPELVQQDRVVVNKLSYRTGEVERGDLIVFRRPPSAMPSDINDLIKRVVATGGETVSVEDGRVHVDGRPLEEPYLPEGVRTSEMAPVEVPEGQLWVMGDNRGNSQDSRYFGPISDDLVVGRAFVKLWPLNDVGGL